MVDGQLGALLGAQQKKDLQLLISEVVTNALIHGEGSTGIVVYVAAAPERIRVEVCDDGPGFAVCRETPAPLDPGRRGLRLVDTIAGRWGVAGDKGTCVWFELDL
jgi:anti-sigma regulatory factor (Ser/Thr protein kinase)